MALLYALACILLLLLRKEGLQTGAAADMVDSSSSREEDPWLATRVLEIPYTADDNDWEGQHTATGGVDNSDKAAGLFFFCLHMHLLLVVLWYVGSYDTPTVL